MMYKRCQAWLPGFWLNDWIDGNTFHWDKEYWQRNSVLDEDFKFAFGHVDFDLPWKHQRTDVKILIKKKSLDLEGEVWS